MTVFTRESGELPRYKGVMLSPKERKRMAGTIEPRRRDLTTLPSRPASPAPSPAHPDTPASGR